MTMTQNQNQTRTAAQVTWAGIVAALLVLPSLPRIAAAQSDSTVAMQRSAPAANDRALERPITIDRLRAHDSRGLNVFEAPKRETVPYTGFAIEWGAAFTQQFQSLTHLNTAAPNYVGIPAVNVDSLIKIGPGFNNAEANLYLDAQLARGIRVAMTSYMSSRHHSEMWVKDGYLLIDGSPWENKSLDRLMDYLTLRVGHFEINYGDAHFRRTDNGNAMYNPLVGNLIMEAFTTEVGGEAYVRGHDMLGMVAVTGGEVRGQVLKPENRSPAVMAKVGFDKQIDPSLRVRLTGSLYKTSKSNNNTLYSGSRSGSRYYYVLENINATEAGQAWSGDLQPGFSRKVTAWVINPFIKYQGLEIFGNIEQAKGGRLGETSDRTWTQNAGEVVYRLCHNHLYAAGRYDQAKGKLAGIIQDLTIERLQVGGGWFLTQSLLAKLEYVDQKDKGFPTTDVRNGGEFKGVMFEAVVGF